jgi:spore germination cell wall hydrolase CwlJ-like protein
MSRRLTSRRRVGFLARRRQALARLWRNLSFRWYSLDKGPLIFIGVLVTFGFALAALVHAVLAYELERRSVACLALNVYFEARGEPLAGQYAVAEVTMNRVASPQYPDTVCAVVYQKNWDTIRRRYVGAFSWTEFDVRAMPRGEEWERARQVAEEIFYKKRPPSVNGALFYHSIYITPSWAREKKPVARIGEHVFYR